MGNLTLPESIPGLLRDCSPVDVNLGAAGVGRGVVIDASVMEIAVWYDSDCSEVDEYDKHVVSLRLTDETGRAHAAWWASATRRKLGVTLSMVEATASHLAMGGHLMTYDQIATLRDLVLRLAGEVTREDR